MLESVEVQGVRNLSGVNVPLSAGFEIIIDANGTIGAGDTAHIDDVMVESALTSIIDLEDSIAAVDAEDKVLAYRNWNKIMRGTLTASFTKNGKIIDRKLNDDKSFIAADGSRQTLRVRAFMLVRTVRHLRLDAASLKLFKAVTDGTINVSINQRFALEDLAKAHEALTGRATTGCTILTV